MLASIPILALLCLISFLPNWATVVIQTSMTDCFELLSILATIVLVAFGLTVDPPYALHLGPSRGRIGTGVLRAWRGPPARRLAQQLSRGSAEDGGGHGRIGRAADL
jgi:hypothetical protein